VPFGEHPSGACLEISLECFREFFIGQRDVRRHFPRFELIGVNGLPGIVLFEARAEIVGATYVCLLRLGDASKDVRVEQRGRLRSLSFDGIKRSPPSLAGWKSAHPNSG